MRYATFGSLLLAAASARTQTGRITGKVTDPTGAAIVDAQVTAIDQDTGVPYKAATSATGVYAVSFLNPGVEVSHPGFKKYERTNVPVGPQLLDAIRPAPTGRRSGRSRSSAT
jgi:hypothetical protein